MTEKIEVLSLGELLAEYPIGSIVFIVCAIIITALFYDSCYKFWKNNKTHVELSTPCSAIFFEMISCFFASGLLMFLATLTRREEIVIDITEFSFFLVIVFLAWVIAGMFAYLDYKNNKPNIEYQKIWDELDEELYIIEEGKKRLGGKIPNDDELKNFHDMINKYNAKLKIFKAKREQLK